jgi:ketosteroid isomerase-like protein
METLVDDLLTANQKFYDAFASLELDAMKKLWMKSEYAKCLHPGWRIVAGYDDVIESWQMIFRSTARMEFELRDIEAVSLGRVGIVTLREYIRSIDQTGSRQTRAVLAATNLFELTDDGWKLIHHQAGPTESDEPLGEENDDRF